MSNKRDRGANPPSRAENVMPGTQRFYAYPKRCTPLQEFWAGVNKKNDAELLCACGKPALFKELIKRSHPKGYCRKCKPASMTPERAL